jgi:hypothetical protein
MKDFEPRRDPMIGAMLSAHDQHRMLTERDLEVFVKRVVSHANVSPPSEPWWQFTADWWRLAVPAGIAAAIVTALLLIFAPPSWQRRNERESTTVARSVRGAVLIDAVLIDSDGGRYVDEMVGSSDHAILPRSARR